MKSIKIIFGLAAAAFTGALLCMIFIFAEPGSDTALENTEEEETYLAEESADEQLEQLAEEEVQRFKDCYGVDISLQEMIKQLNIREEHEAMYGTSYELEEIFLAEEIKDDSIGDAGNDEYEQVILKIQEYVKKYHIDESRYAAMTAEEELEALEIEYGPLDGNVLNGEKNSDTDASGADTKEQP